MRATRWALPLPVCRMPALAMARGPRVAVAFVARSRSGSAAGAVSDPTLEAVLARLAPGPGNRHAVHADIDYFLKVVSRLVRGPEGNLTLLVNALSASRCADLRALVGTCPGPGIHLLGLRDASVGLAQVGLRREAELLIDALAPGVRHDQGTPFRVSAFINDLVGAGAPHAALLLFRSLRRKGTSPTPSDSVLTALSRAAAYAPSRESLALAVTTAGQMHEALRGPSVTTYALLIGLSLEVASRETAAAAASPRESSARPLLGLGEGARIAVRSRPTSSGDAWEQPVESGADDDVDPLHRAFALYDGFCDATGRSCMGPNRALLLGALVDPHTGLPLPRPLIHVALEALRRCAILSLGATNAWSTGDAASAHRPRPGDGLSSVDAGRFDGLRAWHEGFVALENGGPAVAERLEEARRRIVARAVEVPASFGGAHEGVVAIAAAMTAAGWPRHHLASLYAYAQATRAPAHVVDVDLDAVFGLEELR